MRNDAEAVVEGFYAAWRLQDIDATLGYCAYDFHYTVHQPEGVKGLGGHMVGKAAVRPYLVAVCGIWEFIYLAPVSLSVNGNKVRGLTRFHSVHRRTGLPLTGTKRHVWQVENGLITSVEEYHDAGQIKAFLAMADAQ